MLVTIDVGNTHTKFFLWKEGHSQTINLQEFQSLKNVETFASISGPIPDFISSRTPRPSQFLKNHFFLDMPVNYASTVGEDRLAQAYAIYHQQKYPCLFIDAGTFITFNYINKEGFFGGPIFPGPTKLFEAFDQGENLFSPEIKNQLSWKWPNETNGALAQGMSMALRGLCLQADQVEAELPLFLTGGSAHLLEEILSETPLKRRIKILPQYIHYALKICHEQLKKKDLL